MNDVKFYFDENVELAVSEQLKLSGVDAVSAHSLGLLGSSDRFHLQQALALGRILCTYDTDFLVLAAEGAPHAGIVFAPERTMTIGGCVRDLRIIHADFTAGQFENIVLYLPLKT